MNHEELDQWFAAQEGNWDTEHPLAGHKARFVFRMKHQNKKKNFARLPSYKWLAIAAGFALLFGFFLNPFTPPSGRELAEVSPKMQQTQDYFNVSIARDLEKLKNNSSPEDQKLVDDALHQLNKLEQDYNKLKADLVKSDENRRVIHAMITNFQTRILLLNDVLKQLDHKHIIKKTEL